MTHLLEMRGIQKSFPGVHALRGIDLDLHAGEVLALLGENGAGKSTLLKSLGGAHIPDAGTIRIDGRNVRLSSPLEAQRAGIAVIYQEYNLIPALSSCENIFLGRERTRFGFLRRGERQLALELFRRLGADINPDTPCGRLSVAEQQLVEIAKAMSLDARVLVMDEPTAALSPPEVDKLLAIVRDLKSQGIGVIYVSHRLEEIQRIADRVMVMRDGQSVASSHIAAAGRQQIIEWMVGRKLENEFPSRKPSFGEPRLAVRHLCRADKVRDVSFEIRRGEILGMTGLVGAGRTEVARLIFGADRRDSGEIAVDGRPRDIREPRDAIRAGICLLTEDRKHQGLILGQSILHNYGLPNLKRFSTCGFVGHREERRTFGDYMTKLGIKAPSASQLAKNLSGGNQQKVVLAKWLEANCDVILFDEPTRGIDVGAKFEIYQLMHALAAQGKAILMISSELPEVLGMADRILVMRQGHVSGEILDVKSTSQEAIMEMAVH